MESRKYTVIELWDDLEQFMKAFDHTLDHSNSEDADAFALCHKTMQEMYAIGREAQNVYWLNPKKAYLGLKAKHLFFNRFGEDLMPPLAGNKSKEYIGIVIAPFLQKTSEIEHEDWLIRVCKLVMIDLREEAKTASQLAENNRNRIAEYEKKQSEPTLKRNASVTQLGQFANTKPESADITSSDTLEVPNKQISPN